MTGISAEEVDAADNVPVDEVDAVRGGALSSKLSGIPRLVPTLSLFL